MNQHHPWLRGDASWMRLYNTLNGTWYIMNTPQVAALLLSGERSLLVNAVNADRSSCRY